MTRLLLDYRDDQELMIHGYLRDGPVNCARTPPRILTRGPFYRTTAPLHHLCTDHTSFFDNPNGIFPLEFQGSEGAAGRVVTEKNPRRREENPKPKLRTFGIFSKRWEHLLADFEFTNSPVMEKRQGTRFRPKILQLASGDDLLLFPRVKR